MTQAILITQPRQCQHKYGGAIKTHHLQGCPCASLTLCQADVHNVMYNHTDCGSESPIIASVPSPGFWYFIHGGAGAIMSRGLMDLTTFERCQDYIDRGMPRLSGGDYRTAVFHVMSHHLDRLVACCCSLAQTFQLYVCYT